MIGGGLGRVFSSTNLPGWDFRKIALQSGVCPWFVVESRLWRFHMSFSAKVIGHPPLGPKNPFQNHFVENCVVIQKQFVKKSMSAASSSVSLYFPLSWQLLYLLLWQSWIHSEIWNTWTYILNAQKPKYENIWKNQLLLFLLQTQTMKTLQIGWPDPENHCFLQNLTFHYKTHVCTSLIFAPNPWEKTMKNWLARGLSQPCFVEEISKGMQNFNSMRQTRRSLKRVLVTAAHLVDIQTGEEFIPWPAASAARAYTKNTRPVQANVNTINGSFHNHHAPLDMRVATLILRHAP